MGGSLQSVAQQVMSQLSGQFAVTVITIAFIIAGITTALHGHWGRFYAAVGGGFVTLSAAWIAGIL